MTVGRETIASPAAPGGAVSIDNGRRGMRLLVGAFAAIAIVDLCEGPPVVHGEADVDPRRRRIRSRTRPRRSSCSCRRGCGCSGAGLVLALSIALTLAFAGKRGGWVALGRADLARGRARDDDRVRVFLVVRLAARARRRICRRRRCSRRSNRCASPAIAVVLMGDLGDAPHDYAPKVTPEVVSGARAGRRGDGAPESRVRDRTGDRAVSAPSRDRRQAVLRDRRSQREVDACSRTRSTARPTRIRSAR